MSPLLGIGLVAFKVVNGRANAGASANALALTKKQFYQLDNLSLEEGIRLGAMVNALARAHPDFKQAIQSFLKK